MDIFKTLIILILIIILIGLFSDINNNYNNYNNSLSSSTSTSTYYNKDQLLMSEIEKLKNKIDSLSYDKEDNVIIEQPPTPTIAPIPVPTMADDLLTMYDRKTTFDPLYEPTRRPPRHVIMPILGNPYFNYPTRGFTDTYSLKGYLVKENNNHNNTEDHKGKNSDNQILKLFGREKFPNSTEYEYFVSINTGFDDKIKYFLERQTKELYDGDNVYIDILQSKYRVKLLKDKSMVYNPYLF